MEFVADDKSYNVVINRKISNKNTYIRVKNDLSIFITTNAFTSDRYIKKLINNNYDKIIKMINQQIIKNSNNSGFNYLGNKYDIVYVNYGDITFSNYKVFINSNIDINKWLRKNAKEIFLNHLDQIYNSFSRNIPYPSLRIRKMTTRWGVCNTKLKVVTLNLELIKRDTKYLDYVIVHELSHLIYPNHSSDFWNLVEENMPDYKKYRKEMKEF